MDTKVIRKLGSSFYWEKFNGEWQIWTLSGMKKINLEPVCHVSFYEADAYARWKKPAAYRT